MMRNLVFLFVLCLGAMSCAIASRAKETSKITHVLYVTLDGVSRQEMFDHKELMPLFWRHYAKNATVYGLPGSHLTMEVGAKVPVSLPSYQSQMTGQATDCVENNCGKVKIETFPEELIKKAGLKRTDVVSISSWEAIDNAFQDKAGLLFDNTGERPMHDPNTLDTDAVMTKLNLKQEKGYRGDDVRLDKYTLAQALHYYKKYQPRFLWISFNDADENAHAGNLKGYHHAMKFYDSALDKLFKAIATANLTKNTMVIITTDHGRGLGKNWSEHEASMPEAWHMWAFVMNGELVNGKQDGVYKHFTTLSIRPTIEKVFGIG